MLFVRCALGSLVGLNHFLSLLPVFFIKLLGDHLPEFFLIAIEFMATLRRLG